MKCEPRSCEINNTRDSDQLDCIIKADQDSNPTERKTNRRANFGSQYNQSPRTTKQHEIL